MIDNDIYEEMEMEISNEIAEKINHFAFASWVGFSRPLARFFIIFKKSHKILIRIIKQTNMNENVLGPAVPTATPLNEFFYIIRRSERRICSSGSFMVVCPFYCHENSVFFPFHSLFISIVSDIKNFQFHLLSWDFDSNRRSMWTPLFDSQTIQY